MIQQPTQLGGLCFASSSRVAAREDGVCPRARPPAFTMRRLMSGRFSHCQLVQDYYAHLNAHPMPCPSLCSELSHSPTPPHLARTRFSVIPHHSRNHTIENNYYTRFSDGIRKSSLRQHRRQLIGSGSVCE